MENYKKETLLLNYSYPSIQQLVKQRNWKELEEVERIKAIYTFVRDEIQFGYNTSDTLPASQILADGYGQCNTKSTLLMALLRATEIPCRMRGFTIDKALQKGAITGIWYQLAPKNILHSWVEVYTQSNWYILEGVILDKSYLHALQEQNKNCTTTFCGYGVYTDTFQQPAIEWNLTNTYIQDKGINQDFGLFDSPDDFYAKYAQKLNWFKQFLFTHVVRNHMNNNVKKIRKAVH